MIKYMITTLIILTSLFYGLIYFSLQMNIAMSTILVLLIGSVCFSVWRGIIKIPERELGIIYHKRKKTVTKIRPAGWHFINPVFESLRRTIPDKVSVAETEYRTYLQDGIPLKLKWRLIFKINVYTLLPTLQTELAYDFPESMPKVVISQVNDLLQKLVINYTQDSIFENDAIENLKSTLLEELSIRLETYSFRCIVFSITQYNIGTPSPMTANRLEHLNEIKQFDERIQARRRATTGELQHDLQVQWVNNQHRPLQPIINLSHSTTSERSDGSTPHTNNYTSWQDNLSGSIRASE